MLVGIPYVTCRWQAGSKIGVDRASRRKEGVTGSHVLRHIGCRVGGNGGRAGAHALLPAEAMAVTPLLPPLPPLSW